MIRLPDLAGSSCRHFIACGTLASSEKASIQWIKKNPTYQCAKTKSHGRTVFVRAVLGKAFDAHCHLDVATREFFPDGPPKMSATWTNVQKALGPLMGKRITVEAEGHYAIDVDRLPSIITMTRLFDVVQEGVTLKMTQGRLSVTGTPIYAIAWRLGDDPDNDPASIRLEARIETELNEDYLIPMFALLRTGFESFVESGVPSDPQ